MAVKKKLVLFLGHVDLKFANELQNQVSNTVEKAQIRPVFVWTKDGAEADRKVENQKFDIVIIDVNSSRLREAHFLNDVKSHKNTEHAEVIALASSKDDPALQKIKNRDQVAILPLELESFASLVSKALIVETKPPVKAENSFSVDVRILNGILKSTIYVCQQYGLTSIEMQKPQIKTGSQPWKGDIASTIAIQSQMFQGAMILSFDKSLYLKIYENMVGEPQSELNLRNSDAIGELSNMILGNAKPEFTNYKVEMTLPKPLKSGESFSYPDGSASILIPGLCHGSHLYLEVVAFNLKKAG